MGMYTGLRCKVIIKEEYRNSILKLVNEKNISWSDLKEDVFKKFNDISRSSSILFGDLSSMPDSWVFNESKDGFDLKFNLETGLWTFQCSLKDYDNTIEYFITNVLTEICDFSYHIESIYELEEKSTMFEIKNGNLKELDKRINYSICSDTDAGYWGYEPEIDDAIDYYDYDYSYGGVC